MIRNKVMAKLKDDIRPSGRTLIFLSTFAASAAIVGCVQVSSPDKPIVIELNINIKQEVVVRLDQRADKIIEKKASIF